MQMSQNRNYGITGKEYCKISRYPVHLSYDFRSRISGQGHREHQSYMYVFFLYDPKRSSPIGLKSLKLSHSCQVARGGEFIIMLLFKVLVNVQITLHNTNKAKKCKDFKNIKIQGKVPT